MCKNVLFGYIYEIYLTPLSNRLQIESVFVNYFNNDMSLLIFLKNVCYLVHKNVMST